MKIRKIKVLLLVLDHAPDADAAVMLTNRDHVAKRKQIHKKGQKQGKY